MDKTIDDCIHFILKHQENGGIDEHSTNALKELLRPLIGKKYGKKVMSEIEGLITEHLYDQAIKLLKILPQKGMAYVFFYFFNTNLSRLSGLILLPVLSVVLAIAGYIQIKDSLASRNWPGTKGVIEVSKIIRNTDIRSGKHNVSTSTLESHVEYSYTVDSKNFVSDRVSYGSVDSPEEIVKRYPPGKEVLVYYKPGKPEVSVIETGFSPYLYAWFAASVVNLFFWFIFFVFKKNKDLSIDFGG
jgi:hypothetical protein